MQLGWITSGLGNGGCDDGERPWGLEVEERQWQWVKDDGFYSRRGRRMATRAARRAGPAALFGGRRRQCGTGEQEHRWCWVDAALAFGVDCCLCALSTWCNGALGRELDEATMGKLAFVFSSSPMVLSCCLLGLLGERRGAVPNFGGKSGGSA
uniref:Uncharacterized protein n=1 Tax=Oryza punctata TaxID=4537 RepID=A0A0E0L294_ORYPU